MKLIPVAYRIDSEGVPLAVFPSEFHNSRISQDRVIFTASQEHSQACPDWIMAETKAYYPPERRHIFDQAETGLDRYMARFHQLIESVLARGESAPNLTPVVVDLVTVEGNESEEGYFYSTSYCGDIRDTDETYVEDDSFRPTAYDLKENRPLVSLTGIHNQQLESDD